ncbi:hypothetical protein [Specibacter sp. NPDC078709]|uniref:hypothetical protein n=1 Tax=Specibacter sp. NPDC078709 TaxID=3154364 RepID=UPI003415BFB6
MNEQSAAPFRRGALFDSEFHDEFGQWPVAYIPYGGPTMGEITAVARAVSDGDDAAFLEGWVAAGDAKVAQAEAALAGGHRVSAREIFLRASSMYATSLHPLFGAPPGSSAGGGVRQADGRIWARDGAERGSGAAGRNTL